MGQSYAAEASLLPRVFLLVLSAGSLKRRSLYFVTKLSDHLPLKNKACRVWQLFLPMEKILGPITVETPQFLGFVVLQHCLGGGQCGGLCSAIIRNRACMVLLNLVISASPLIFCQLWQVFLVMLFWLCSSEVFCSVSVANAVLAYWNISAGLQLPQLFHSCHPVSW